MESFFLNGTTAPCSYELRRGINSLGRNPANNLQIADASVSSFHCRVELSTDLVLVKDLGSTNGTFIDGQPVQQAFMQVGQVLRLGSVELTLDHEPLRIAIPSWTPEADGALRPAPDGAANCSKHPAVAGTYKCEKCNLIFCGDCVRLLKRVGGQAMVFCTSCGGTCRPLDATILLRKSKKKSLLGRLTQTIRLRLK
jgi:FHA domain